MPVKFLMVTVQVEYRQFSNVVRMMSRRGFVSLNGVVFRKILHALEMAPMRKEISR